MLYIVARQYQMTKKGLFWQVMRLKQLKNSNLNLEKIILRVKEDSLAILTLLGISIYPLTIS